MFLAFSEVNYLAVVVAAVATFLLGGLWYTALFGKLWVRLHGYTEEQVKKMQAKLPPVLFFGGMIVADLVIAFAMALLEVCLRIKGAENGAVFGLLVWIGPAAGIHFTSHLASDKHIGAYFIDVSYQFLFLVMMGVLFATWR